MTTVNTSIWGEVDRIVHIGSNEVRSDGIAHPNPQDIQRREWKVGQREEEGDGK